MVIELKQVLRRVKMNKRKADKIYDDISRGLTGKHSLKDRILCYAVLFPATFKNIYNERFIKE